MIIHTIELQLSPYPPHPPQFVAAKSLINPPFVDFIDLIIIYNLIICGVGCLIYKKLKGMILNVFYRHARTQEV